MTKNNSKCRKRCWNVSLPFEDERFYQLEDEFMKREEIAALFRQKEAMHKQIYDALPEGMKSVFMDYSDNNSYILELKPKFFYKRGFIDAVAIMRFLRGVKNNIKLIMSICKVSKKPLAKTSVEWLFFPAPFYMIVIYNFGGLFNGTGWGFTRKNG